MCTIQLSWCIPFRGRNGTAVTIISLAVKWTLEIDPVAHIARFQEENSQFIDDRRELRKRREHPHSGVGGDDRRPFQEIVRTHIQEL